MSLHPRFKPAHTRNGGIESRAAYWRTTGRRNGAPSLSESTRGTPPPTPGTTRANLCRTVSETYASAAATL